MPEIGDSKDVIEVTIQDLSEEQKLCLESLGEIRNKVVQKASLPTPSISTSLVVADAWGFQEVRGCRRQPSAATWTRLLLSWRIGFDQRVMPDDRRHTHNQIIPVFPIQIILHVVRFTTTQFHQPSGRSREAVLQVLYQGSLDATCKFDCDHIGNDKSVSEYMQRFLNARS